MIREVLVEPQAIAWLPWAVSYFFFIGIALCAILTAICLHFFVKPYNIRAELIALLVALSFAIVAPIALTADLHQPGRVWHFYAYLANWSWMAWGSIFLPIFLLSLIGYVLFLVRQLPERATQTWLSWIYLGNVNNVVWCQIFRVLTIISSILILLYTSMEVYNVAARPLWNQPWLIPLIIFSALPSALMLIHFAIRLATGETTSILMKPLMLVSLVLLAATVFAIDFHSSATHYDLSLLWQHRPTVNITLVIWVITLILALISGRNLIIQLCLLIASLILTAMVRWVLLLEVQTVAKYNALINPYHFSWGVDGALGMLSVFGLWVAVSVILWQIFTFINKEYHHG
ncbi:NrfD/PsrC family molybdoenzyme membrane anchor subunit [Gallibacterium melopsittaci]|uniref:NrfD/PsrC family molybdoenzyme membrane anchor subunit n=1 Tax=Gallibacterium melopsittaci TaxID=516063 RepID=A0ABV6HTG4_9PAST